MTLLALRHDFLYSFRSSSFLVAFQRRSSRCRVRLALIASGVSHLVIGFDFLFELTFRGATRSNSLVTTLASCSQKSSTLSAGDEKSSDSNNFLSNSRQLIFERFLDFRVTLEIIKGSELYCAENFMRSNGDFRLRRHCSSRLRSNKSKTSFM